MFYSFMSKVLTTITPLLMRLWTLILFSWSNTVQLYCPWLYVQDICNYYGYSEFFNLKFFFLIRCSPMFLWIRSRYLQLLLYYSWEFKGLVRFFCFLIRCCECLCGYISKTPAIINPWLNETFSPCNFAYYSLVKETVATHVQLLPMANETV